MAEIELPAGPPPSWLDDFERELGEALDACDPASPTATLPEGTSLADLRPGSVVAVFTKKPGKEHHDEE